MAFGALCSGLFRPCHGAIHSWRGVQIWTGVFMRRGGVKTRLLRPSAHPCCAPCNCNIVWAIMAGRACHEKPPGILAAVGCCAIAAWTLRVLCVRRAAVDNRLSSTAAMSIWLRVGGCSAGYRPGCMVLYSTTSDGKTRIVVTTCLAAVLLTLRIALKSLCALYASIGVKPCPDATPIIDMIDTTVGSVGCVSPIDKHLSIIATFLFCTEDGPCSRAHSSSVR